MCIVCACAVACVYARAHVSSLLTPCRASQPGVAAPPPRARPGAQPAPQARKSPPGLPLFPRMCPRALLLPRTQAHAPTWCPAHLPLCALLQAHSPGGGSLPVGTVPPALSSGSEATQGRRARSLLGSGGAGLTASSTWKPLLLMEGTPCPPRRPPTSTGGAVPGRRPDAQIHHRAEPGQLSLALCGREDGHCPRPRSRGWAQSLPVTMPEYRPPHSSGCGICRNKEAEASSPEHPGPEELSHHQGDAHVSPLSALVPFRQINGPASRSGLGETTGTTVGAPCMQSRLVIVSEQRLRPGLCRAVAAPQEGPGRRC